jgi:hypothetical protein
MWSLPSDRASAFMVGPDLFNSLKSEDQFLMWLQCFYYLAGIGSFLVAAAGLVALFFYAKDTKALRRAAQEQLEISIRPYVLFIEDADLLRPFDERNLLLKNLGAGIAINIKWRYKRIATSTWMGVPALAPNGFIRPAVNPRDLLNGKGIECEFESASGARYRSFSFYSEEADRSLEIRHDIQQISGPRKLNEYQ